MHYRQLSAPGPSALSIFEFCGSALEVEQLLNIKSPAINSFKLIKAESGFLDFDEFLLLRKGEGLFEAHFHGGFGVSQALRQFMQKKGWTELANAPSEFINLKSPLALRMLAGENPNLNISDEWRTRLLNPPRIALLGPPNVGKSTLFNAWLREKRVTVTSHKGTTRDFVEEPISLGVGDDALAATLIDSAGIWDAATDANDAAAVEMSLELIAKVDECVWIIDSAAAINDSLRQLINSRANHGDIVCLNRCDLATDFNLSDGFNVKVISLDMPAHQQRCAAIEEALFKKWGAITSEQLS